MGEFDTSGSVQLTDTKWVRIVTWPDLSPFAQGYVEAMLGPPLLHITFNEPTGEPDWEAMTTRNFGFSDLAPETLAAILKDCEVCVTHIGDSGNSDDMRRQGATFWGGRQQGLWTRKGCPPLTPYMGDDGKVYLREQTDAR